MLIDRLVYRSRLKDVDPLIKSLFSLICLFVCIWADSFVISAVIMAVMLFLIIAVGKTSARDTFHLMTIPMSFALLGSAAIAVSIGVSAETMTASFHIGGIYIGIGSMEAAARVFIKCFGLVSCMYFLSLTTPMTDVFALLRKSPLPDFIVEITELVYRYIFVLYDAAERIRTAQDSRLGYVNLRASYHSTANLAANIFMRAYRQADKSYTAMEARCYNGEIRLLGREYIKKPIFYIIAAVFIALLISAAVVCRKYGI